MPANIRAAADSDLDRIKQIAVAAEMFTTDEVAFFDEMFAGALDGSMEGHQWLVAESEMGIVGAAQFAPEPFADRMWNLYFIAVDPSAQGSGAGRALMDHVESELRSRGEAAARTLIVETSSTDQYQGARAFYSGLGYDHEATIREFYGPGDHKVVFWKQLHP
jgi:ribosomal protein S18 acetylase RimI-like enzyme